MNEPSNPSQADRAFFACLLGADAAGLARLLTDDFILIDVMRGGEVPRAMFLEALSSGQLVFEVIQPSEVKIRPFESAAIVSGRTLMQGRFAGEPFSAASRYTHVYVRQDGAWRLASAQGTAIAGA